MLQMYLCVHVNGSIAKGYRSVGTKHSQRCSWMPLKIRFDQFKIVLFKYVRVQKIIEPHIQSSICRTSLSTRVLSAKRGIRGNRIRSGGSFSDARTRVRLADAVGISELTITKLSSSNSRVRRGSSSSIGSTLSRLCLADAVGISHLTVVKLGSGGG